MEFYGTQEAFGKLWKPSQPKIMGTFFFTKTLQSKKHKQGDDVRGESAKMSPITPHLTGKLLQEGHLC